MNYGMPYMGSKNRIIKQLMAAFPAADHFYDLFGGGGAVTHAAALSGKYQHVHYNELNPLVYSGFDKAIHGEYANETRWISREDFARLKNTDFYVAYCWSFGNKGTNYLYSVEIEPWKKALHYARVFHDCSLFEQMGIHTDGSRADIAANKKEYKAKYIDWFIHKVKKWQGDHAAILADLEENIKTNKAELQAYLRNALKASGLTQAEVQRRLGTQMAGHYFGNSQWEFPTEEYYNKMREFMPGLDKEYSELYGLQSLYDSLQSLGRLQSLQSLERLQRNNFITLSNLDYQQVKIPPNSVIYCDIPYKGTVEYTVPFNYERFYSWARQQENIFISEYDMPADFTLAEAWGSRSILGNNDRKVTEKLFTVKAYEPPISQLSLFELGA